MQQFELTHEFLSQLEELIDAGNKTEVSKQIAGLHPADIAERKYRRTYRKERNRILEINKNEKLKIKRQVQLGSIESF